MFKIRKVRDNGGILGDLNAEGTEKKVRASESSRQRMFEITSVHCIDISVPCSFRQDSKRNETTKRKNKSIEFKTRHDKYDRTFFLISCQCNAIYSISFDTYCSQPAKLLKIHSGGV